MDKEQLMLLREAVAAELQYWDALRVLERALVPVGELSERANDRLVDWIGELAAGLDTPDDVEQVTDEHLQIALERARL